MTQLTYTIVVRSGPDAGTCHQRSIDFIKALLDHGHRLQRVFFYSDGARVALPWEPEVLTAWQSIATSDESGELILCSASAERYGVEVPPDGFVIAGLGSLMEAGLDSDRVLTFA